MINPEGLIMIKIRAFLFQFHIGMINPEPYWGEVVDLSTFQFHIGMINPTSILLLTVKLIKISIPHWYD